jgi:Protein of unknwon function (DUF3008)
MTFFYDLNKKLSDLAAKQTLTEAASHQAKATMKHVDASDASPKVKAAIGKAAKDIKPGTKGYGDRAAALTAAGVPDDRGPKTNEGSTGDYSAKKARAGKDIGKPGKNFAKIAKGAAERYGSKERGEKVAGAVLNKLRHPTNEGMCPSCNCNPCKCNGMEESAFQAAIGKKKYGDEGMKALQKAGRDHASAKTMSNIRDKYDKYDEGQGMTDEGNAFSKAVVDAKKNGIQPGEKIKVGGKTYPVKESHGNIEQVLGSMSGDVNQFKRSGELSDALYNTLFDYYSGNGEMPYGVQKARSGDPYEWISQRLDQELGMSEGVDKQKFAALAPPRDKITFADKIAGAKKEVDEMLGDVAAEAMKAALGKGKKVVADESREDDDDVYSYQDPAKAKTHKTASGGTVTRHGGVTRHQAAPGHYGGYDPESHPDKDDDKPGTPAGEKRGKGRPKGTGKSIGAKGPSGKSKLMTREDEHDIEDQGEYDREGEMAKNQLHTVLRNAKELHNLLGDNDNLPEWVQSKLAKIEGMMKDVSEYMQSEREQDDGEEELDEKAVSKKQQKFMGMVHAAQKGEKPASKEVAKVAKTMKKKDAEDFASTKHKGLPEKKTKKKEEVEETTTAGSVATAPAGGKAKANGMFGKGVYEGALAESFDNKLNTVLTEGMSINMSVGEDGTKTLSVNATDDDAVQLAQLLKMAGLGGSETCSSCGESACGCEQVAEGDLANSPEPEYSNADTMLNTLSGGLNGRKTTGQSTIPVINKDPARTIGMHEHAEKRLWDLYNRYERK